MCVLLIEHKLDVDAVDKVRASSMHVGTRRALSLIDGTFCDSSSQGGSTALHLAAMTGHVAVCKVLIPCLEDIDAVDQVSFRLSLWQSKPSNVCPTI